jgi:hypothetical protein
MTLVPGYEYYKSPTRGPALAQRVPNLRGALSLNRGVSSPPSTSPNDRIFSRFVQNSGVANPCINYLLVNLQPDAATALFWL